MRLLCTLMMASAVVMAASLAMAGEGCCGKKASGVAGVAQKAVTVEAAKCACGPDCAAKCGDKCACPTGKAVGAKCAKADGAKCATACAAKQGARATTGAKNTNKAGTKQVSCTCATNNGKTTKANCRDCQGPKDGKCPANGKPCNKQKTT